MLSTMNELKRSDVPNYATTAAACALSATTTLLSAAEGNTVSYYFSLASTLTLLGMAANQFGLEKSRQLATSLASQAKDGSVRYYNSFFKAKETEAAASNKDNVVAPETEKPTRRIVK